MNFNAPLLRPLRILLFPISILYGFVIWIRNKMFDSGFITSAEFNIPLIGVGNLSAGGTGKSPMVEFILGHFSQRYQLAVLSRGYKRKTSGYALANQGSTALEIGDEPMLFYNKFPEVNVSVGEERIEAIPQLLHDRPDTQAIILDDAFQHRSVKAGMDILLTDYHHLFTRDWFLPTGNLRDSRSQYKRAQVIVVTKCPHQLTINEKSIIIKEIKPTENQQVFFTTITYGIPYHIITKEKKLLDPAAEVLLVSGIADPRPLKKHLLENASGCAEILFSDHHIFSIDDLKNIRKKFESIKADNKIIITTEKDSVRLVKFRKPLEDYPFYVIPIETQFLFDDQTAFTGLISNFIGRFNLKTNSSYVR